MCKTTSETVMFIPRSSTNISVSECQLWWLMSNFSTWKAEAGGLLQVQGQSGLNRLFSKQNEIINIHTN